MELEQQIQQLKQENQQQRVRFEQRIQQLQQEKEQQSALSTTEITRLKTLCTQFSERFHYAQGGRDAFGVCLELAAQVARQNTSIRTPYTDQLEQSMKFLREEVMKKNAQGQQQSQQQPQQQQQQKKMPSAQSSTLPGK